MRTPDASEATLKRALDRGARSLLVPMVNSAEMAREIAASVHYAPQGRRGYAAPIVRASGFGVWEGYAADASEETLLAVQIEHVDAIEEAAAIAATPGIDIVFIGPNDLACSMGFIERLAELQVGEAITRIERAVRGAGALLGTIEGLGRDAGVLRALGYGLVIGPNDVMLLAGAARTEAGRFRGLLGAPA